MLQQHKNELAEIVTRLGLKVSSFEIRDNDRKTVTTIIHGPSGLSFQIAVALQNFYQFKINFRTFKSHLTRNMIVSAGIKFPLVKK